MAGVEVERARAERLPPRCSFRRILILVVAAGTAGLGLGTVSLAKALVRDTKLALGGSVGDHRSRALETAAGGRIRGLVAATEFVRPAFRSPEPLGFRMVLVVRAEPAAALWASIVVTAAGAPAVRVIPLPLSWLEQQLELVARQDPATWLVAHVEASEFFLFVDLERSERTALFERIDAAFGFTVLERGAEFLGRHQVALSRELAARIRAGDPSVAHLREFLE